MLRLHNLVTSWISPVDPDEPRKAVGGQSWTSRWSVQPILVALRKACLSGGYGVGGGIDAFLPPHPLVWGSPFSLGASGSWFARLTLAKQTGKPLKAGVCKPGCPVSSAGPPMFTGPHYVPGFVLRTRAPRKSWFLL